MGTHYQGTPEAIQALDAYIKITRAAEAVTHRVNAALAEHNLTISQFGVLEALLHLGPLPQNQLAGKILKSTGNLTMVLDNLEKRGLAARRRSATDRRVSVVELTPAGQALIEQIFPQHVGRVIQEFSVLTAAEQTTLARLCKTLGLGG